MSQSSFVLEKDLQFTDVGFLAKTGDVFVFTPPQTMVVYRNGDIQIRMWMSQAAIDGLLINGSFKRVPAEAPQVPKPEPIVPLPPVETPVVTETNPTTPVETPVVTEEAPVTPEEPVVVTETTPETPVEAPVVTEEAPKEDEPKATAKPAKKAKK